MHSISSTADEILDEVGFRNNVEPSFRDIDLQDTWKRIIEELKMNPSRTMNTDMLDISLRIMKPYLESLGQRPIL